MAREQTELNDQQWAVLEPILTLRDKSSPQGRPRKNLRMMAGASFYILRTGAPWRDLPAEFGPWQSAYHYFNRWAREGTFEQAHQKLLGLLHEKRAIEPATMHVDSTFCRANKAAAGATKY